MKPMQQGFTLAELAIVIVIIGLVAGGILGGQALISVAETRSVISDVERYRTSIGLFEQQYFALPGDMQNADDFWAGAFTGDGDGLLDFDAADNEALAAWSHLSLAELEPSSLTATGGNAQPGINIPAARVGGGYTMYDGTELRAAISGITTIKNFILLGRYSSGLNEVAAIPPSDALAIDDKMDDGDPEAGAVFGRNGTSVTGCIASNEYAVQNEIPQCIMEFRFP